ncbi:IDEAL domain-containing protein [Gracilibacillus caseinilyticus]|uniref:IDEAL domain-containing protein n=1 Tax=Gracilibacillus caseinilyticus TaxID=2932256 RepID=A0ABY4F417_9BACI|nr:IDEAL domain-containing protein [Gracilibacillus caseinilyticus]UOQ50654.1 IDEAL domain-containing protein [Gracilibacillus caseinilyticus]
MKLLKPYYVKEEGKYIRVVLAYQYFSLLMDDEVYHFVPLEAREIRINRDTQQIENKEAVFVFQKGKKYNRMTLSDLMKVKDFQQHLSTILSPYMIVSEQEEEGHNIDHVIMELERSNLLRLIDNALDDLNEEKFDLYTTKLNEM